MGFMSVYHRYSNESHLHPSCMLTLTQGEWRCGFPAQLTFPAGEPPEKVGLLFIISLLHPQPSDPFAQALVLF